jgi:hypothetical protein
VLTFDRREHDHVSGDIRLEDLDLGLAALEELAQGCQRVVGSVETAPGPSSRRWHEREVVPVPPERGVGAQSRHA